ncbi:MAG: DUF4124 domain-containing protein [Deltaproteobacteria bacterium]|nr:DUF4124 domain-containing protein [Deltaproteobacteria bacterium]
MALILSLLIALPVLVVALAIGAGLLVLACKIVRVESPGLTGAMWTLFVAAVVQLVVVGGLLFLVMGASLASGDRQALASLGGPAGIGINLAGFALTALVFWRMLGLSSYARALLLNLVYSLLGMALALLLALGLMLAGNLVSSRLNWSELIEQTQRADELRPPPGEKALGGTVYRWKDAEGRTRYSESPPPSGTDYEVVEMAP